MKNCSNRPAKWSLEEVRAGKVPSYSWVESFKNLDSQIIEFRTEYGGNFLICIIKKKFFFIGPVCRDCLKKGHFSWECPNSRAERRQESEKGTGQKQG